MTNRIQIQQIRHLRLTIIIILIKLQHNNRTQIIDKIIIITFTIIQIKITNVVAARLLARQRTILLTKIALTVILFSGETPQTNGHSFI